MMRCKNLTILLLILCIFLPFFSLRVLFLYSTEPCSSGESRGARSAQNGYSSFSLKDFYAENSELDGIVHSLLCKLSDEEKIAQMVVTSCGRFGKSYNQALVLFRQEPVGGVVFLGNTAGEIEQYTASFRDAAKKNSLFFPIFAVDGEPSLIHEKITGARKFPAASSIKTQEECRQVAHDISALLLQLDIHVNYAPVCDFSTGSRIIGNRSFGNDAEHVSALTEAFITTMQNSGIVATAKHFPGHGTVDGDTHHELVFVDGLPPELPVFQNAVYSGVLSIMVGHIGVNSNGPWDTGGMPSTFSENIVSRLLKKTMGFQGIIITDALNMEAVKEFDFPSLAAVKAGCDMVLMPEDEIRFINSVRGEIILDEKLRSQVMESVKKIIRLKVCLGLVNYAKYNDTLKDW